MKMFASSTVTALLSSHLPYQGNEVFSSFKLFCMKPCRSLKKNFRSPSLINRYFVYSRTLMSVLKWLRESRSAEVCPRLSHRTGKLFRQRQILETMGADAFFPRIIITEDLLPQIAKSDPFFTLLTGMNKNTK